MVASPQSTTRLDQLNENDANSFKQGIDGYGVFSGLAVSAGTGLQVSVATGSAYFAGTKVTKASPTLVSLTAADPTNPRRDIIVMNSSGTISAVAGTAAAATPGGYTKFQLWTPYAEPIPSGSIILGEVYVAATATSLVASDILDKRILLGSDTLRSGENIVLKAATNLNIYASNGTTLLFTIDDSGNVGILGRVYSL
jgi:hypothetical protein